MTQEIKNLLSRMDEAFDGLKRADIRISINETSKAIENIMALSIPMIRDAAKGIQTPIKKEFEEERTFLLDPKNTNSYVLNIRESLKVARDLDQKYGIDDFSKMMRRLLKISMKVIKQDKQSFKKMQEIWKKVGRVR